jgi:hypothetical protein
MVTFTDHVSNFTKYATAQGGFCFSTPGWLQYLMEAAPVNGVGPVERILASGVLVMPADLEPDLTQRIIDQDQLWPGESG